MKKMIYTGIYIICLVITIFIFSNYQKKFIILIFNNEKIYGEITSIEHIFEPRGGSYNRIYYTFDYNGEKYIKSINKNTGEVLGIIDNFISLLMNRHYRIGQKIQVIYNSELKFSYIGDELLSRIIMIIIQIIFIPFIALIIIISLKIKFIECIEAWKPRFRIFCEKKIFYIQDKKFKIKEDIIDGIFDYNRIILEQLVNGRIICYGIKKDKNFIELSYFNNKYIFRVYKDGIEEEIINNENKNVMIYFEKLVNEI
jgi:hypothetical protein